MKIIDNRKKYFIISGAVLSVGIIIILINMISGKGAFNYDVEFAGGLSYSIDIGQDFNNNDILNLIEEVTTIHSPQIQRILGTNQVTIKLKSMGPTQRSQITQKISDYYGIPESNFSISDVSATVSSEMKSTAMLAVVVASIVMLVYISIRFGDIRTGSATIIALIHDALFMLVVYGVLRIPLNNTFIAAILTILGYSVNSTVIIFDRLRENKKSSSRVKLGELIDKSINQTLARCMYTTLTTLLMVGILYVMGVPDIREFALPIMIGLLCGTYTSIFFAGSILYAISPKYAK